MSGTTVVIKIATEGGMEEVRLDEGRTSLTLEELLEANGAEYNSRLQYRSLGRVLNRYSDIPAGSLVFVSKEHDNG